jgi:hypothetical protein
MADEKKAHDWVTDILERENKPAEPIQLPTKCAKCQSESLRLGGGRSKCLACGDIQILPGYAAVNPGLKLAEELTEETKQFQRDWMRDRK